MMGEGLLYNGALVFGVLYLRVRCAGLYCVVVGGGGNAE